MGPESYAVGQVLAGPELKGPNRPLFIFGQTENVLAWIDDHSSGETFIMVDWSFKTMGDCVSKALSLMDYSRKNGNDAEIRFIKWN